MQKDIFHAKEICSGKDYYATEKRAPLKAPSISFDIIGGEKVMPIAGWYGPYKPSNPIFEDLSKEKYFKLLKDCGVNTFTVCPDDYVHAKERVLHTLQLAEKYEIATFVYDTRLKELKTEEALCARLDEYRHYRSCIGFHVFDEPYPDQLPEMKAVFDLYGKLGIDEQYMYVNLLPVYGKTIIEKFDVDYPEYLEMFCRDIDNKFLSYDYYPFYYKGEGMHNAKQYFYNMALAKSLCDKYEIPLWTFIQAGGQFQCVGQKSMEKYPSEEEMRWNVNTCLAYGVKSIQYFTLIQPAEFSATDTGYDMQRIGLIGCDGEQTVWYDYAKRINEHIAFVDEVLMGASCQGVLPVGKKSEEMIVGTERLSDFRELIKAEGGEGIVGCFDYQGKSAFYVVCNSTTEGSDIELTFDKMRGFDLYFRLEKVSLCGERIGISLKAGEGVLLVLK